jgi:hypothetical protein
LIVSYRTVSLAAGLVAVSCLTALAVVTAVHDADALTSTAIALAVITFIVQLIVYVAQAEQSQRENQVTQLLHVELRKSLTDLSDRTYGTKEAVERLAEQSRTSFEVTGLSKLKGLPDDFAQDFAENLEEIVRSSAEDDSPSPQPRTQFPRKTWGPEEDRRILALLTSWPTSEAEIQQIEELVGGLPDEELRVLGDFAEDELDYRNPEKKIAPSWGAEEGTAGDLYERGLIEEIGDQAYGLDLAHLTDAGRQAARIFTAAGEPPAELAELVSHAREFSDIDPDSE